MKKNIKFIIVILIVLLSESAFNQDTIKNIDDYYIDFSIPDLGAFTLLNSKPDNISTPGNTKEFAASLLNIVSSGSAISPGLAIDWAPIKTFFKTTTPDNYKKNFLLRNLQLTFGTIADSLGTRVGAGIKWTFIDKTDPLMDIAYSEHLNSLHNNVFNNLKSARNEFTKELRYFLINVQKSRKIEKSESDLYKNHKILTMFDTNPNNANTETDLMLFYDLAIKTVTEELRKSSRNSNDSLYLVEKEEVYHFCLQLKYLKNNLEEYNKNLINDFNKAKKQWLNDHWNATVITVGSGIVANSIDSKWSTLNTQFYKSYLNGKFKVSKKTQAIGMLSYGIPQNSSTNDSSVTSQIFIGGRFLAGNASNRFSVDLGYSYDVAKVSSYNSKTIVANIGVEFKIDDGIFFEIAGGLKGEPTDFFKNSNILALGSLKYALHPKARDLSK